MRDRLKEFQEETGHIYNLEATPAEGTSYRLAKVDRQQYPKIITSGEKESYYTNSTLLPVNHTDDLWFALKHQENLQTKYTGGTVFHVFLGESPNDGETTKALVKKFLTASSYRTLPSHQHFLFARHTATSKESILSVLHAAAILKRIRELSDI